MSTTKTALQKALKEQQDLDRVIRYINDLDQQLAKARAKLSAKTTQQLKEFEDVRKLEKASLKSIFYKVLGSKEEQIEKERQEYLQVALEYDEAKKSVELLEYERSVLEKKLTDAEILEKRILKLKKAREKEIIKSHSLAGQRLLQMAEEEDQYRRIGREIEEAIQVGQKAAEMLNQIISLLRQASGWGQWGRPGRNFNPARYTRHSSIDRAKDLAYRTQNLLRQFESELADVYKQQRFNLNIELGSFNNFINVFFDNLISDWVIQQKVQHAASNVASVRDRVIRLLGNLQADRKQTLDVLERTEREREELLWLQANVSL